MNNALVGYTGFVGSNLDSAEFSFRYNSSNIGEMAGKQFDTVVCAGVQAKKWWANQNPEADWEGIERLWSVLKTVSAHRFFLISTVDVFRSPVGVCESDEPEEGNSAYGRHRLEFERLVSNRFSFGREGSLLEGEQPSCFVLRLPGLFGQGLKKNVIYDLIHDNGVDKLDPSGSFQYYDLSVLPRDMVRMRQLDISLLHLAAAPVLTGEIVSRFFPEREGTLLGVSGGSYDFRTKYWDFWEDGSLGYLYTKEATLARLGEFLKSQGVRV